jgi:hypothetical protein
LTGVKRGRKAGIDASKLEIRPAKTADRAWTVTEIDRSWPTQVDACRLILNDAGSGQNPVRRFPANGKTDPLGRGFPYGDFVRSGKSAAYRVWSRALRDDHLGIPAVVDASSGAVGVIRFRRFVRAGWRYQWGRLATVISVLLGLALPVMGVSLALFVLFDWLRWRAAKCVARRIIR